MRKDIIMRTVRTASGAIAVQLIRYENKKRIIMKHVGSAHTEDELTVLQCEAKRLQEELSTQLSLSFTEPPVRLMHADHLSLRTVTHCFSYKALRNCSQQCGLGALASLYQDLLTSAI